MPDVPLTEAEIELLEKHYDREDGGVRFQILWHRGNLTFRSAWCPGHGASFYASECFQLSSICCTVRGEAGAPSNKQVKRWAKEQEDGAGTESATAAAPTMKKRNGMFIFEPAPEPEAEPDAAPVTPEKVEETAEEGR
eukprot:SAG11_NODE_3874_length_2177_cov_1.636670_3_plen_138_part_00